MMKLLLRLALLFLTGVCAYASIEEGQALLQKANEMHEKGKEYQQKEIQLMVQLRASEAALKKAEDKASAKAEVQDLKNRIATLNKEQKALAAEAKKTKKQAEQIIKKVQEEDVKRFKVQNKDLVKFLKDKAREYKVRVTYQEGPSRSNGAVMTMGFSKYLEAGCTLTVYISYSFYRSAITVDYALRDYTTTGSSYVRGKDGERTRVVEACPKGGVRKFSISFDSAPATPGIFYTKITSSPIYESESYEEYSDFYEKVVEKKRDVLVGYRCESNIKLPKDFMVNDGKGGNAPFLKMLIDSKTLSLGSTNTNISYIGQLVLVVDTYKNAVASTQAKS